MINTIFKMMGAAEAAANLLFEFKIPEKKDDKLTNNKKGNVILVNSTARLNLISSEIKPGAIIYTRNGVNISAIVTINSKINEITRLSILHTKYTRISESCRAFNKPYRIFDFTSFNSIFYN